MSPGGRRSCTELQGVKTQHVHQQHKKKRQLNMRMHHAPLLHISRRCDRSVWNASSWQPRSNPVLSPLAITLIVVPERTDGFVF